MDPGILGGIFLGWSLGANDTANVFGTAVSSYMVRFRTAAWIIAVFVVLGAMVGGGPGMETLAGLTGVSVEAPAAGGIWTTAFFITVSAAATVTLMTVAGIPVSTSQAVVGGIIGFGLFHGGFHFPGLGKVVSCWLLSPFLAAFTAVAAYFCLSRVIRKMRLHFLTYDRLMRILLLVTGAYGAYALGANNVANVTGVFYQPEAGLFFLLLVGGLSIGLGAVTYSRKIMFTVGRRIIPMDAFTAFIVVLAHSLSLDIFARVGVPVSSSQAVVGAVVGLGMLKNARLINRPMVSRIIFGWCLTPPVAGLFAYLLAAASVRVW